MNRTWSDSDIDAMIKSGMSIAEFKRANNLTAGHHRLIKEDIDRLGHSNVNLLRNVRRRRWSKEEIEKAVSVSHGLVDCWRTLTGMKSKTGGAISRLKKMIEEYGIDTSRFSTLHHVRTRVGTKKFRPNTYSDSDIFRRNTKATKRTVFDRYTIINPPTNCSRCQLRDWLNEPIILQLDHKNGHRSDCRLSNLRWLCPNCHTQTPTYSRGYKVTKIKWPPDCVLLDMNERMSGTEMARKLKASPVYVAKKLRIARSRLDHSSKSTG